MKNIIICISILLVCSCKSTQEPQKKPVKKDKSFSFARCERIHNEIKVRLTLAVNHLGINDSFVTFAPHLKKYLQESFVDFLQKNKHQNQQITVEVLRNYLSYLDGFLSRALTLEQRMKIYSELSQTFSMIEYTRLWYEDELYKPYQIQSFLCFAEGLVVALHRYELVDSELEDLKFLEKPQQIDMRNYITSKTNRYENPVKEVTPERSDQKNEEKKIDDTESKSLDLEKKETNNLDNDWKPIPEEPEMVPYKETETVPYEETVTSEFKEENGVIDLSK
ncbi:hypothetical protein [Candidatus Uabimicrobium sp. HlEnr_7]|uniref:hypothetical protein n=1 Tax=Candidatus Uabimicrobium helgolandensis TaxID=3095367 RepID=UPI00355897B9